MLSLRKKKPLNLKNTNKSSSKDKNLDSSSRNFERDNKCYNYYLCHIVFSIFICTLPPILNFLKYFQDASDYY
jgi:hypothetical protein